MALQTQALRSFGVADLVNACDLGKVVAAADRADEAATQRLIGTEIAARRQPPALDLAFGEPRQRLRHALQLGEPAHAARPRHRQERGAVDAPERIVVERGADPTLEGVAAE